MESKIQAELMAAMKEKNAEKIAAIREIKTAIMKFKTAPGFSGTCTEADILTLIQKLAKQHKESADMYQAAGREDLVKEELAQLAIRKLTPKEAFLLQGFPQDFADNAKMAGVADGAMYKQAGNAVSVNTIYAVLYYLIQNRIIKE
jgi:hypothetical protein